MADTIDAIITDNLVAALHGKTVTYNGAAHTTTAEQERAIRRVGGRYPFIELQGPFGERISGNNVSEQWHLHYVAECRIIIDDSEISSQPITQVAKNLSGDIRKLIIDGGNLGGRAELAGFEDFGHYFELNENDVEFVVYVVFYVKTLINRIDPTSGG